MSTRNITKLQSRLKSTKKTWQPNSWLLMRCGHLLAQKRINSGFGLQLMLWADKLLEFILETVPLKRQNNYGDRSHQFTVSVQFVTQIFGRHTNKCYQVNARSAVGKDSGKTCYIERFNNTVRQRVARLVRKTLSFSKSIDNHIGAVWYFVHHYNASLRQ